MLLGCSRDTWGINTLTLHHCLSCWLLLMLLLLLLLQWLWLWLWLWLLLLLLSVTRGLRLGVEWCGWSGSGLSGCGGVWWPGRSGGGVAVVGVVLVRQVLVGARGPGVPAARHVLGHVQRLLPWCPAGLLPWTPLLPPPLSIPALCLPRPLLAPWPILTAVSAPAITPAAAALLPAPFLPQAVAAIPVVTTATGAVVTAAVIPGAVVAGAVAPRGPVVARAVVPEAVCTATVIPGPVIAGPVVSAPVVPGAVAGSVIHAPVIQATVQGVVPVQVAGRPVVVPAATVPVAVSEVVHVAVAATLRLTPQAVRQAVPTPAVRHIVALEPRPWPIQPHARTLTRHTTRSSHSPAPSRHLPHQWRSGAHQ